MLENELQASEKPEETTCLQASAGGLRGRGPGTLQPSHRCRNDCQCACTHGSVCQALF